MTSAGSTPFHASQAFRFEMFLAMVPTFLLGSVMPSLIAGFSWGLIRGIPLLPIGRWGVLTLAMYGGAAAGLWGFWRLALAYRAKGPAALLAQPTRNWLMAHTGAVTAAIAVASLFFDDGTPKSTEADAFQGLMLLFSFGALAWVPYLTLLLEYRRARLSQAATQERL